MLCREEKQCALSDKIIKNGSQNENQQIAKPFFSSLLEFRIMSRCNRLSVAFLTVEQFLRIRLRLLSHRHSISPFASAISMSCCCDNR